MDDLKRKTMIGLAQLAVALGLMLFIPAWTLAYWQAWLFMFVFLSASTLITVYVWRNDKALLARRLNAGAVAEKEKSQKLIQIATSAIFVAGAILPSLDHRFGWSQVPISVVIAGDILIALGFYIVFLVFKENSFAAATVEVTPGQTVISTGPHAVVRHPMYLGALIMLFGTPFALGSWWGLVLFAAIVVAIIFRILEEEKFLAKNLPGYTDYCAKVRYRLLPLIW